MSSLSRVILKPRRARPFFARHPWLFANSIDRIEDPSQQQHKERGPKREPAPGAEVEVVSHEGKWIARGLFNPHSAIRVRLYRWENEPLDEAFWRDRLSAAVRLRTEVLGLNAPDGAVRLVNSEGDGLSGLVVDRYGPWLVLQVNSLAIYERLETLVRILTELTGIEQAAVRTDRGIADQEGLKITDGAEPASGAFPDAPLEIVEHGLTYQIDIRSGQKTGFYVDQRDNRLAVAKYAKNRRVLDLFCHSGGFSLNALKHGGARSSLGVDSSAPALEFARRNARTNGLASAEFEKADVLEALRSFAASRRTFGLVICDPPKFARNPDAIDDALKAYVRLNLAALSVLEPDGILVTCSCSGLVDRQMFTQVLGHVAEQSGRALQILEQRSQAPDHPVAASCLESDYLKCVVCRS